MPEQIENLLAKMFIARPDVMAEQHTSGIYTPVQSRFTRTALQEHLKGERSLGHYLVGTDNQIKMFAFDIDWEKEGRMPSEFDSDGLPVSWVESSVKKTVGGVEHPAVNEEWSPRALWRTRSYVGRKWMKGEMMAIAWRIAATVREQLGMKTAVAYSGYKGLHVYAFLTNPIPAEDGREGAQIVLEDFMKATAVRGSNFYKVANTDSLDANENISIEIFPKQTKVQEGGYGNLMRLPLGRNLKAPNDPTFFVDLGCSSLVEWEPVPTQHVVEYLQNGNPWQ